MLEHPVLLSLRNSNRKNQALERLKEIGISSPVIYEANLPPPNKMCEALKPHLLIQRGNGAVGCLLSHQGIVRMAQALNWQNVFIIEDDAEFKPDFIQQANQAIHLLPENWEIFILGTLRVFDPIQINEKIWQINDDQWGTHCYIIRNTIYQKYIDYTNKFIYPADFLGKNYSGFNTYCVLPTLSWQTIGNISQITNTPQCNKSIEAIITIRTNPVL